VVEGFSEGGHAAVEFLLAGVAEGRVADVVSEGEGFGEVLIEAETDGDGAGDLGDLEGVGEAIAEMVGDGGREDLGLIFEATKGAGVDDTVPVALKVVAVGVGEFRVATAPASGHREAEARETLRLR